MNLELPNIPLLAAGEEIAADLWTLLGVTSHPVAPLPDAAWLREHPLGELIEFLNDREEGIRRMRDDPLNFGWEPPTWRILDALCGFPWADPTKEMIADERDEARRAELIAKQAWCLKVRRRLLRQAEPIRVLLLNGGNRAGKSEWAASRVIKLLLWKAGARAWCFHQDDTMSVEYQQPLLYKYLPAELKTEKGIKRNPTYIAYKQQTGFSEGRFVLSNRSDCSFRNYQQDPNKHQGGEIDIIWCTELMPATLIRELKARIATRGGWLILDFTPVTGYTAAVKMFLDIGQITRDSIAFVLPKDGGTPELELALQGDDAAKWADDEPSQPAAPAGRQFEKVPRVMCCPTDRKCGVFFFHSFDNAFGNPRELYSLYRGDTTSGQKMRFYGVAHKAMSGQFPRFKAQLGVHLFRRGQLPKRGTRYMVVDPVGGRNWAMLWALVERTPAGLKYWIYREWPCPGEYVPGEGDLGLWAEPGDKLDGMKGPAQRNLGWGVEHYLQEVHRLEGRKVEIEQLKQEEPTKFDKWDREDPKPPPRRRKRRTADDGEDVYERFMDSRYGALPTLTREGQTTLLEECSKLGMHFVPASGKDIDEGVPLINGALFYDEEKEISSLNAPRLLVCENCLNVIFALSNWTNADGQHGACKDFIDLLRYLMLAEVDDWSDRAGDQEEAA